MSHGSVGCWICIKTCNIKIYNCTDLDLHVPVLQHGEFILMLLWIVDLALESYGVILPLVLEIYYVYVY